MKKNVLFVALASVMLATSCAEDVETAGTLSQKEIKVHANVSNIVTRATETTTDNLDAFKLYSYISGNAKNYMDKVKYEKVSGNWQTSEGTFYWPATDDLNFYAVAPYNHSGLLYLQENFYKIQNYYVEGSGYGGSNHEDLVYAKATGNLANNGSSGIDLTFNHALSEVKVLAKNDNSAFTVQVSGVRLGNICSYGDFNLGAPGEGAYWSGIGTKTVYQNSWLNPITLSKYYYNMDVSENPSFMLIPQKLEEESNIPSGSYLALKAKITMQGGQVLLDDWVYVGISTNWEMGNCYTYIVDFTTGIGTDESGNAYISNKRASYSVNVKEWNAVQDDLPHFYIKGTNYKTDAFSATIDGNKTTLTPASDGTWKYEVTGLHPTSLNKFLSDCSAQTLNLNGLDVSEATDMSELFSDCTYLTSLNISRWETSSALNMAKMFNKCGRLESLDLSNFDTSNVTNMADMFHTCYSLTSLNVKNFNTSKVTDMSYMFSDMENLTSLDISGWKTSKVTDMHGMFSNCNSLSSINMSGWDMSNVTNMNYMFNSCTSLKTIYMVGCNDATIAKVKSALSAAGISTDIVKTSK